MNDDLAAVEKYIEKIRQQTTNVISYNIPPSEFCHFYNTKNTNDTTLSSFFTKDTKFQDDIKRNTKALKLFLKKLQNKCVNNEKLLLRIFEALDLLFQYNPLIFIYIFDNEPPYISDSSKQGIWFIFESIFQIVKKQVVDNYEFANKVNKKFIFGWCSFSIDLFGINLENLLVNRIRLEIMELQSDLMSIFNDISNGKASSRNNLDFLCDKLTEFLVYFEWALYIKLPGDLIIERNLRFIFYLLGNIDSLDITMFCLIFKFQNRFLLILKNYIFVDNVLSINKLNCFFQIIDNILSDLTTNQYYHDILVLGTNNNDQLEKFIVEELDVLPDILLDVYECIVDEKLDIVDFTQTLNVAKWFQIYNKESLPFSTSLNGVLIFIMCQFNGSSSSLFVNATAFQNKIKNIETKYLESANMPVFTRYIYHEVKELNYNITDLISKRADLKVFLHSRLIYTLNKPGLDSSDLKLCIRLISKLDCQVSSECVCVHCTTDENKWNLRDVDPNRLDIKFSYGYKILADTLLQRDLQKLSISVQLELLFCLRNIFHHFQVPLKLEGPIYKFVTKCYDSQDRILRTISSAILVLYAISSRYNNNDKQSLLLMSFLESPHPNYTIDTRLETWAQFFLSSRDEIVDPLLKKLLNYVNSHDFIEEYFAIFQIRYIAKIMDNKSPYQLLSPILPLVVSKLSIRLGTNPGVFKKIANLTERPIDKFLERFQRYIVPYVITYYKKDIIQHISNITGTPKKQIVYKNINRIIAVLLVSGNNFSLPKLIEILCNCEPSFKNKSISDVVNWYIVLSEIAQLYDNCDELQATHEKPTNKLVIMKCLYFVFNLMDDKRNQKKKQLYEEIIAKNISEAWNLDEMRQFEKYMSEHILGIFHFFSSSMSNNMEINTYFEKIRIINGVTFMINNASEQALISSLAIISLCLQVAMEIPEVRYYSMKAWYCLVKLLSDEQLFTIIDLVVYFICQRWNSFDTKTKTVCQEIFNILLTNKKNYIIEKKPSIIYSLMKNEEINLIDRHKHFFQNNRKFFARLDNINIFLTNLESENVYIVLQTLDDIKLILSLMKKDISEFNIASVSKLLGLLLNVSYKFKHISFNISTKATECISLIGSVDPTVYKITRKNKDIAFVYDLSDYGQQISFIMKTMNKILVPAFWQTTNRSEQSFIAYVMQEYIKFCNLDLKSCDFSQSSEKKHLWDISFNDLAKATLEPLRSSKYSIGSNSGDYSPLIYPFYNKTMKFQFWVRGFSTDLLKRLMCIREESSTSATPVFSIYSSLLKEANEQLCEYILPYAVGYISLKRSPEYKILLENIKTEFLSIFRIEVANLNHHQLETLKQCYEVIFKILEYCKQILAQYNQKNTEFSRLTKEELNQIEELVVCIPLHLMAQRSLEMNSFERSVLYLEQSYRSGEFVSDNDRLREHLQTAYANIQDLDAIDGVLKKFTTIELSGKLDELLYSDNWEMAQQCLEELSVTNVQDYSINHKYLESLHKHQLYDKSLVKLDTLITSPCINEHALIQYLNFGLEASVMYGKYEKIGKYVGLIERRFEDQLKKNLYPHILYNYNIAKLYTFVYRQEWDQTLACLDNCNKLIARHFITSPNATTILKIRQIFTNLHSIHDLKVLIDSRKFDTVGPEQEELTLEENLEKRLVAIGDDFGSKYKLLSLKKTFLNLSSNDKISNKLFLTYFEMAQISRQNGRQDLASKLLMDAWSEHNKNQFQLELEYSNLLWERNEKDKALKMISEIYNQMKTDKDNSIDQEESKVLLKYTQWLDLSNSSTSSQIIKQYKHTISLNPHWEEPYFALGLFYSRFLEKKNAEGSYEEDGSLEKESIKYFLLSFEKNTTHVRESLPKVITYWLNTSEKLVENRKNLVLKTNIDEMCVHIDNAIKSCPSYIWYSVLIQLISRVLHPHQKSSIRIGNILYLLCNDYPEHILWYIASLQNSNEPKKVKSGQKILEKFVKDNSYRNGRQLVSSALKMVETLSQICKYEKGSGKSGNNNGFLDRDLKIDLNVHSNLVVPVTRNFDSVLPLTNLSSDKFEIFPNKITINSFGSEFVIYHSLRRPKKIQLYGSDGNLYEILCKMEDVSQDNQYMQFATNMVYLLKKDLDSKKRNLGILTYAILSLNEDFGIIELVQHVSTVRSILISKYSSMNKLSLINSVGKYWKAIPLNDTAQRLSIFHNALECFTPVLHEWFLDNFPDPINWYNSKQNFSRSYAVMCMVGHILGLGDRHCDNILINVKTGQVLHVDFDILFDKGKDLKIPEIVPFRLTHNFVDALGITGIEGTFRKACEVTLTLIRGNELTLINVIETIMYGRMVRKTTDGRIIGPGRNNWTINQTMEVIRNKMRGIDPHDGVSISVTAQTDALIKEAISDENLCKMFIGWLPFW
ncbi:uncharacterized protein SCODWIG_00905 [Saccharomycodes ludwigii]|uniref:Serine/threonine-protein kinase MEC1 n=1 Tax=Saccharomycodes ludwigii TaxID=36035 RepID=A0A376B3T0_9ASCO|nr:uncharacterized protein SCODWIG_00905 [Saccharomycodes ludwigii]